MSSFHITSPLPLPVTLPYAKTLSGMKMDPSELSWKQWLFLTLTLYFIYKWFLKRHPLDHIPTIGYSSHLFSFFSAIRWIWAGKEIVLEGYAKYPDRAFKVPLLESWLVIVNGPKLVDDMRRASEEYISFTRSISGFFQFDYTFGPQVSRDPYHIHILRSQLARNVEPCFEDIKEEMVLAFDKAVPLPSQGEEWVTLPAYDTSLEIVSKISARFFVGLPLCRNEEYRLLCVHATMEIVKSRILNFLPVFLRPLGGRIFTDIHGTVERTKRLMAPLVEERLKQERLHGRDWPGKPNDLLSWLLDGHPRPEERTIHDLAVRTLLVTFASIHTTSQAFTHALYDLATKPEYIQPMREEIEALIENQGWTKNTVTKMYKVDSFLRESQRFDGMAVVSLGRKVLKDFTLSDGTCIPAGSSLSANSWSVHHDEAHYANAHVFDGFRFVREGGLKQPLMAIPTLDYMAFGHGRPTCPGRFFAVTELKSMLAHVILNYDVRLENGGPRPANMFIESSVVPDRNGRVMFRRRKAAAA